MSKEKEVDWPVTREANRRLQLRATVEATAEQRLEWLEDVLRLAASSGALERRWRTDEGAAGDG